MPLEEKALRAYVKVIGDKAYLRTKKFLIPNQTIGGDLENIRTSADLDRYFSYFDEDDGAVVKRKRIIEPNTFLFLTNQGEIAC